MKSNNKVYNIMVGLIVVGLLKLACAPTMQRYAPKADGTPSEYLIREGSMTVHFEGPANTKLIFKEDAKEFTIPCDVTLAVSAEPYSVEIKSLRYANYAQIWVNTITDFTELSKVNVQLTQELMDKANSGDLQAMKIIHPEKQIIILQLNIGNRPFINEAR